MRQRAYGSLSGLERNGRSHCRMNDWKREVDYATYCPKCKSFKVLETDEPCNECLTECAREGTVKPLNFKEAKVSVK